MQRKETADPPEHPEARDPTIPVAILAMRLRTAAGLGAQAVAALWERAPAALRSRVAVVRKDSTAALGIPAMIPALTPAPRMAETADPARPDAPLTRRSAARARAARSNKSRE